MICKEQIHTPSTNLINFVISGVKNYKLKLVLDDIILRLSIELIPSNWQTQQN